MNSDRARLIADRYVAVWAESDAGARRTRVESLWRPEAVEYIEGTRFEGHDGLDARVREAYEAFIENGTFDIARADDLKVHGDVLTFTIQLVSPESRDVAWAARVFAVVADDERLSADYHLTVQPLAV